MNYIKEIEAFEDWLEVNHLSPIAQLLWYKLLVLCNRAGWSEWIVASDQLLMAKLQITSKNTLITARKKLIEAGLIEYKNGVKGKPSMYKLNSVSTIMTQLYKNGSKNEPYVEPKTEFGSNFEPYPAPNNKFGAEYGSKNEPYPEPYSEPNKSANADVSSTPEGTKHKLKHIYLANNITEKQKEYNKKVIEIFLRYRSVESEEDPIEAKEFIKCLIDDYGFKAVEEAVNVMVERNRNNKIKNPHNYLISILEGERNAGRRDGNCSMATGQV